MTFGAVLVALCAIIFGLLSSYRVESFDAAFVWQVSAPRVLVAFTAGMAFSVFGATVENQEIGQNNKHGLLHTMAYGLLMAAVFGLLLAHLAGWGIFAGFGLSAMLMLVVGVLSKLLYNDSVFSTLLLAILLALAFALNVLNFAAASASPDILGAVSKWALGDITYSAPQSIAGFVLASILVALVVQGRSGGWAPMVLLGVGLGMAGPILFVGWLVPTILRYMNSQQSKQSLLLCSALLGGSLIVLMDTAPSLLLGGYAPPLSVPVALLSIPFLLWWNHQRLASAALSGWHSKLEAVAIIAAILSVIFVLIHVVIYAHANT